ncbi:MAG: DUF4139 domain-containing protein [Siculibacillus sp.]|nr:DUF4139 domain-containing protein [Siculibacillus sp.]
MARSAHTTRPTPPTVRRRTSRALLLASAALLGAPIATQAAELPLKRVVLSTSGLAQFTHGGKIIGGSSVDLPVRLDQVDDILKSLTVFDALGAVGTVSLPGREPLDELFRDLPFDRAALESPQDLINALVGAEVEIKGPVEARGRVLKAEPVTVQLPDDRGTATRHRLSLVTDTGIVQAVLEKVTSLTFTDPQTRAQIERALAGLRENRAKDRRSLSIGLAGQGEREVSIGYVVAAPIWKTSWRLVLPKDGGKAAKARLQGWAVLENLTGGDWKDVDLTLVSGRPVALTQALYSSVHGQRQTVPLTGTAAPTIDLAAEMGAAKAMAMRMEDRAGMRQKAQAARPVGMAAPAPAPMAVEESRPETMAGGASAAAEEGSTQLLYRFPGRVSLATGHTMMVPFVDREVPVERVWLYRPDLDARRPFAAARLVNDGDTGLPPGIVTAFEIGGDGRADHVGDAMLPLIPRGAQKFATFALDTKTEVRREDRGVSRTVLGTTVDGRLTTTIKSRRIVTYEVTAPPDEDRDVLVEEERPDGWTPAPEIGDIEATPTVLRRHVKAAKGTTAKAELVLERTDRQVVVLTTLAAEDILARVRGLSNEGPALKQAVEQLSEVVGEISRARGRKAQIDVERKKIADDQDRIRKNLASAGQSSDLGRRYLDTLRKQEDQLGELGKAEVALDATIEEKRRAAAEIARRLKL